MVQKRTNLELLIIEVLLRENTHIRNIASQLKESHTTILRKLNNLKDNNVVDSKTEGKNKIFFLKKNIISENYVFQTESNKLINFVNKYPKIGSIFEEIIARTDENLIVLFGSYAKGLAKKDSDIDIYVETNDKKVKNNIENIYSKINVKIGKFNPNSELIREIIKNHIIVKGIQEFYERKKLFEKTEL